MIISSDYHTHTIFSHGKGDVIDNVKIAKQKGLIEIGITDHGFNHPVFGLSARKIAPLKEKVKKASETYDIKVYTGIESNLISTDGSVDLKEKYYDDFDLFVAGYHKFIIYKFASNFNFSLPSLFYNFIGKKHVPKSLIKNTTKAYVNAIRKNPIDIISHLNYCCFSDSLEVAKCAEDYGTYLEISSKKAHLTDDEINDILAKTKVKFIVNSDAHSIEKVGDFSLAKHLIKRLSIPEDRIVNVNGQTPDFRFTRYKKEAGRWLLAK